MPIDAYSLCPCGTGKKIKFCCPDLLGELQKIERMLEGEQNLACLSHIERLQEQEPYRACLLAIKATLLRAADRWDEARANAATFVERHPGNPTALAESVIVTLSEQGGRAAMGVLQQALAASDGWIPNRVYQAMGMVAEVFLSEGHWLAGRALLHLQTVIHQKDDRPLEILLELNGSANVPLLLKDDTFVDPCPDDAPWKDRYNEALIPLGAGHWQAAAEKLAALAEEVADSPTIWRNLATLRGWLADEAGCIEALRRFAATEIPLEDAVEAQALALFLADNPLGDPIQIYSATWTIRDVEHLQAALTLESRVAEIPLDSSLFGEGDTPPPRAGYLILDRPLPDKAEDLTLETVSRLVGQALLYGRQTDREARLHVFGVTSEDLPRLKMLLEEIAGGAFDPNLVEEKVLAETSASQQLLRGNWQLPRGATAEQSETLAAAHARDALLVRWPQLKLGIFDGKSPQEVAGDESCRVKLLAALMVLQSWNETAADRFDFNELRCQLGLPTLEPIDPSEVEIERLPLGRLSRVMVEKASDGQLRIGYGRAEAFRAAAALEKFARAILDRASLAGSPEQLLAYGTLAAMERDPQKALEYVELGRTAAKSAGFSCVSWDLTELKLRFARRETDHLQRLVEHIQSRHIEERGVAEAMAAFLVSEGVLRPDGTPVARSPREEPSVSAEAEAEARPRRLWTPDSQQLGGQKRIWTPDGA